MACKSVICNNIVDTIIHKKECIYKIEASDGRFLHYHAKIKVNGAKYKRRIIRVSEYRKLRKVFLNSL